ncbi:hypothetical protein HYDPIDRAFT_108476 [Hydnomerulius pinastri MD-312]|nr:hypothetical protein HYDPIDRAFT_108476 [Hydnomerulius pinastri MD-312]
MLACFDSGLKGGLRGTRISAIFIRDRTSHELQVAFSFYHLGRMAQRIHLVQPREQRVNGLGTDRKLSGARA